MVSPAEGEISLSLSVSLPEVTRGGQGWHRMSTFCPLWRLLSPEAPEMGPGLGSQQCFGLFPPQPQPKLPELREHSHWELRLNKLGWCTHVPKAGGDSSMCHQDMHRLQGCLLVHAQRSIPSWWAARHPPSPSSC